ncbi:MAG: DMT family transporter [Planctomycetota bacterium]
MFVFIGLRKLREADIENSSAIEKTAMLRRGRVYLLASAVLWSTSGVFVKNLALPAIVMAEYRAILAGITLLCLVFFRRVRISWNPWMLGMVLCFASMNFLFISSMTLTTAANTIFLQYTAPFWMFLASVLLLREPIERANLVSLGGAMVGIVILILGQRNLDSGNWLGIAYGLGSGVMFAGVAVFLRVLRSHDAMWLAALNHLSAGIILATVSFSWSIASGTPSEVPSYANLGWLALFGVGQMAIPYVLFALGMQLVSPQEAGIITLLEPVLVPTWTFLSVGEKPSSATLFGGAVLIGMVLFRYLPTWRFRNRTVDLA